MLSTAHEPTWCVCVRCCWTESVKCARPTTLIWSTNTHKLARMHAFAHFSNSTPFANLKIYERPNVYSRHTAVRVCLCEWLCFLHSLHFIWFAPLLLANRFVALIFVWGARKREKPTRNNINSYDTRHRPLSDRSTENIASHHMRSICQLMMMLI